jgi:hypothetical protein
MCTANPRQRNTGYRWTNGREHNHCARCPGLGACMFDERAVHCGFCDGHYSTGVLGNLACGCKPYRTLFARARAGDRAALATLYWIGFLARQTITAELGPVRRALL